MDIHKVTIQLHRPRGSYEGRVETGYYTVVDDTVTLVEPNGVPVDKHKLARKLDPGGDARLLVCRLLRERYSGGGSGNFNRPLQYPKVKF
jgi:hypothetical protein